MATGLIIAFAVIGVLWLLISTGLAISLRMSDRSIRAVPAAARTTMSDGMAHLVNRRKNVR